MNPISFPINSFLDERERWFLWVPVLIGSGIALYFGLKVEPSLWFCALSPLFLMIFWATYRLNGPYPIGAALLAVALGFNAAQIETAHVSHPVLAAALAPTSITGTLMRAEALPEGARLTLKKPSIKDLPKEERPALLRIKVKTPYADLPEPGTRVNVWGPLWPPNDSALPGGYDFRRQAFFKQLGGTGLSYVPPRTYETRYLLHFFWDGVSIQFEKARRSLTQETFAHLTGPAGDMTAALLSGNQTSIDKNVMEAMRASGLSHLLSISGVHVSMMALLVYVPLRFLFALFPGIALRWPIKKIAAFTAILATALYTCLVGADAPTVRSALMTGLVFFAIMMDRRAMSLRLVALAACAIMLTTPSATMGASFQMSFAAVLAMIAAYEKRVDALLLAGIMSESPAWVKNAGRYMRDITLTSLIATAATTPFTIFHFQTFSFYGVLANMIAIPLTTLWILPCLLLTYITAPFNLSGPFLDCAGWGSALLIFLAQKVAAWPLAQIPFPAMPAWAFGSIVIGGLWLCLWKSVWRFAGLIGILAGCLYPFFVTQPSVYISDDKNVWAVVLDDGRLAVYGKRKEDFTIGQWLQHSGIREAIYINKKTMESLPETLSCDEAYCAYQPQAASNGPMIVFLNEGATPETVSKACANSQLVLVSFSALPDCTKPRIVIDAEKLQRLGAHTLSFIKNDVSVQTVRTGDEQRPWTPASKINISEQAPPSDLAPAHDPTAKGASHTESSPE